MTVTLKKPAAAAVPIHLTDRALFAAHTATLPPAARQWLASTGFHGAPDTHALLPDADGRLAAVWAGVRAADHPWALAALPRALPAGRYALRGRVRIDGLRNERGLVWQVACLDGRELGRSDRFAGSAPWQSFVLRFERPADDCAGQVLTLRLDARIAPEQMIGGRILFDDLRIVAVD